FWEVKLEPIKPNWKVTISSFLIFPLVKNKKGGLKPALCPKLFYFMPGEVEL
ncbi:hypothetical protein JGI25_01426, partial [Candidatus Kryptobacter tengchongensis]